MTVRRSYTANVERNTEWTEAFATEPYEAAWASEAIFFIRALDVSGMDTETQAHIQISPDGIHWCNEGTAFALPTAPDEVTFGRVAHFGGWLRVRGDLKPGQKITVIVYVALKE